MNAIEIFDKMIEYFSMVVEIEKYIELWFERFKILIKIK